MKKKQYKPFLYFSETDEYRKDLPTKIVKKKIVKTI